jgi:transposase
LVIVPKDKKKLRAWTRSTGIRAGLAQRARIVLMAGHGYSNTEIARTVGVSRPTVLQWRNRYAQGGLEALEDRARSGRPRTVSVAQIVVRTLEGPPEALGVTHWSSRLLADELSIGNATVARVWREWELQPWRVETFKFSTDPQLEAKVRDIVGLYLNPPENAIVLCVDESGRTGAR